MSRDWLAQSRLAIAVILSSLTLLIPPIPVAASTTTPGLSSMSLPSAAAAVSTPHTGPTTFSIQNFADTAFAIRPDGTAWSWGLNASGLLGNGTSDPPPYAAHPLPTQISGVGGSGSLTGVASIAGGDQTPSAILSDGTMVAWGSFPGDGTGHSSTVPVHVAGPGGTGSLDHVIASASSDSVMLALRADGTVWAWGSNHYGELGQGTSSTTALTPVEIPGPGGVGFLNGVVAITAGLNSAVALKSDGTLWTWGQDGRPAGSASAPYQVPGLNNVVTMAAGDQFFLAVEGDGSAWGWGNNSNGTLGNGTTSNTWQSTPSKVVGPGAVGFLTNVTAVSAGETHALAVKSDGTVWSWGVSMLGELGYGSADDANTHSSPGQVVGPGGVGHLTGIVAVDAGYWYSGALRADGSIWTWGWNSYGQLGDGTSDGPIGLYSPPHHPSPVQVLGPGGNGFFNAAVPSAASCTGRTIAAGNSSSVALKGDGSVWTWGGNWAGQLGNGSTADSPTPVQVQGLPGPPNTIAAGYAHVLAAMPDGSVWAWGDDQYGELGDGNAGFGVGSGTGANRSTPVQVLGPGGTGHLSGVVQVAGGYMFSVALKSDGTVWQWGSQLGSGALTPFNTSPVQVSGLSSVVAIAAPSNSGFFAMALKADGTVWTWGLNTYGNLGNGTTANSAAPVEVLSPDGSTPLSSVASIAAGRGHALAAKSDGTVWAWGQNRDLQLGIANNGSGSDVNALPGQVIGPGGTGFLSGVAAVTGLDATTIALKSDGTVWGWGFGDFGQVGAGSPVTGRYASPTQVHGVGNSGYLTGVIAIAGGWGHTVALRSDGSVDAWGSNGNGQLGNGTATDSFAPVQVTGLSGIASSGTCTGSSSQGPPTAAEVDPFPIDEMTTVSSAGSNVNTATGSFWRTFTDLTIPGRGIPLAFGRTYDSSMAASDGPLGHGWTHTYNVRLTTDSAGNVTVHEENGSTIPFTPSSSGFAAPTRVLASLTTNADGTLTLKRRNQDQLVFNVGGQLIREVDRNGYTTTLGYTGTQLTSIKDAGSRVVTLGYWPDGHLASVTDPTGRGVTFEYDAVGDLRKAHDVGGGITYFSYDSAHRLQTMTDPRNALLQIFYDSSGRVNKQIDPLSRQTLVNVGSTSTTVTEPNGSVTVHQYANNELTSRTAAYGTSLAATWSYTYDPPTLARATITDPNQHTVTNTYDTSGNLLTHADGLNRTTRYTYDSLNDLLTVNDPIGRLDLVNTYDAAGNLTKTTAGEIAVSTYSYDPNHPGDRVAMMDPNHQTWHYAYDQFGNQTQVTDPLGEAASRIYDSLGRVIATVTPKGNVPGFNQGTFLTSYTPDAFGHVTQTRDPLGNLTRTTYDADGNLIQLIDGNNHTTRYDYDLSNRPTVTHRADGTSVSTAYDDVNNTIRQIDGLGKSTTYRYNLLYQEVGSTDALQHTTGYSYDAAGNLKQVVDPRQRTTTYSYDAADQLRTISHSDGVTPNVAFTYDADGQRIAMQDGSGTSHYDYDSLHRFTVSQNGAGQSVAYGYDLKGNLTSLTYPGGNKVTRTYDAANHLIKVTDWLNHGTVFGYDVNGNLTEQDYPNGVVEKFGHDPADRLTAIDFYDAAFSLAVLTPFSYDGVGNITARGAVTFTYDALNRLTLTKVGNAKSAITYDTGDNLKTTTVGGATTTLTYDDAHALKTQTTTGQQPISFSYDALGNRIQKAVPGGTFTYSYDQANRLTQFSTATFKYDGDGLRTDKTEGVTAHPFAWELADGSPLLIKDGAISFVTGPSARPLEQILADGTTYYYHADQVGSTNLLTDSTGRPVDGYLWDAYGNRLSAPPPIDNSFQYAGQYTDAATGLDYMRARYYDPIVGGFLTRDPAVASTRQPYSYAGDSPTNATDPTGLYDCAPLEVLKCVHPENLGNGSWLPQIAANVQDPHALGTAIIAGAVTFLAAAVCVEGGCAALATGAARQVAFGRYMIAAQTADVSTASDTAVMYSGQVNRALAEEFAAADARVTLEMTPGGADMEAEGLFSASRPIFQWQARMIWDRLSQRYAQQVTGEVVAFVEGADEQSTFVRMELPELLRPDVVLSSGGG